MNMNFFSDLSVLFVNYAGESLGQQSSPTALTMVERRSRVECQKVWKFSTTWLSGNGTSNILGAVFWYPAQIDEPLFPPLCANKRRGRLMRRCPSCITTSHGWLIILPTKSRAGQQGCCTQWQLFLSRWVFDAWTSSVSLMKRVQLYWVEVLLLY